MFQAYFVCLLLFFAFFLNIALLFSYSGLSRSVTLDISHHWGSAHGIGYDCVISTTSSGNRIKKRTSKMNVDKNVCYESSGDASGIKFGDNKCEDPVYEEVKLS